MFLPLASFRWPRPDCRRISLPEPVTCTSFYYVAGDLPLLYQRPDRKFTRVFRWKWRRVALPIVNRGQRYELTPPVAVEVLRGEVKGRKKRLPRRPLYVRR